MDGYGPSGRSPWLEIDWREHQRFLEIAGRRVNVIELGDGPPLLFVHGLSGSWQNWLENIPHFGRRHRVVALDLPGFGASEMPADEISIPGYGRVLDAVCERLGIDAAAVVGNSMGGFIASELAIQCPERIERLVLVSAAGVSIEDLRRAPALALARLTRAGAGWLATRSEAVVRRPRLRGWTLGVVARHPNRLPAELCWEQLQGSGKPGFVDALDALTSYRIRDRLGDIACPALIVWGADDQLVPAQDADEFERLIPNSRKVVFQDTGHVSMLERPAHFNRVVEEFLAE